MDTLTIEKPVSVELPNEYYIEKIKELKAKKSVVILAHYYQRPEVQDLADFVGDSLELSRKAQQTDKDIIVFCGVRFMCETAKILNPNKKVLHPNPESGCPMADMATVQGVLELKEKYPDAAVVSYVNTSAEVKAVSDICVTSANAVKIVSKLEQKRIIFVPDMGLGNWVKKNVPDKEIIIWKGFCPPHYEFGLSDLKALKERYPNAVVAAHPECNPKVLEHADFIGSTSQIINFATTTPHKDIIVITEVGLKYVLQKKDPTKNYIFPEAMHYCGSPVYCCTMKGVTLANLYTTLRDEINEVTLPEDIILKAKKPIERMLELSK
jgi:quinolinate synthetase A